MKKSGVVTAGLLELRTLAFALTNEGYSLARACEDFEVAHRKLQAPPHGVITEEYVDYNRGDVRASAALLERLRAEFDKHPIDLRPEQALSPASVAKRYLRAMSIVPPAQKFTNIRPERLGAAMTAFFGGRVDTWVRRVIAPVVYTDFLSMYPTVNILLGLWPIVIARRLELVDAKKDVRTMLERLTLDQCFTPAFWRNLTFFALIEPEDTVLPLRADYDPASRIPAIGVNHVTADEPLWYAGPDVIAAALLSEKTPRIIRAFRLVPHGVQAGLRPTKIGDVIPVHPAREDFFRKLIETRKGLGSRTDLGQEELRRLDQYLKVVANSASYGINAEFTPHDIPKASPRRVRVYGLGRVFGAQTCTPEAMGEFCFPPLAALVTAGARLMLALLERTVIDAGGVIAFSDTDSGAIVAMEEGGMVPCAGGPHRLPDGRAAVRALSYAQVERDVVGRFSVLNPYDPSVIAGSILQIDKLNNDPDSGRRHQLLVFAVSAKRYVLFTMDRGGRVTIRKPSEHGLGHLLGPDEGPRSAEWSHWIGDLWMWAIEQALGRAPHEPAWFARPAVSQLTVTSPHVLRPLSLGLTGLPYANRVKPMNFMLSGQVLPLFGLPDGLDAERFHPIAPFEAEPAKWLGLPWVNKYTGEPCAVGVGPDTPLDHVRLATLGDVASNYLVHPEPKFADAEGNPCGLATVGLLRRRHVRVGHIRYTGKEAHRLEETEHGLVHQLEEVRATFLDPRRDPWRTDVLPMLRHVTKSRLAQAGGISAREVQALRNGAAEPKPRTALKLVRV